MATIDKLSAREILDSRGMPTLEISLSLNDAAYYHGWGLSSASVPAGKSVGSHEAKELRDGGRRFGGKGVQRAVELVKNEISQTIVGRSFTQAELDRALIELDGTPDKSRLGANTILGISLAFARAQAAAEGKPLYRYVAELSGYHPSLPQPCFNVINGGAHANSGLSIQEFMFLPAGESVAQKIEGAAAYIATLQALLHERGLETSVGDEGGFAPRLPNNEAALGLLREAMQRLELSAALSLDAAATHFYTNGSYALEPGEPLSAGELTERYLSLCERYPINMLEDPFAEDDFDAFARLAASPRKKPLVVGDDLTTTNFERVKKAAQAQACGAAVIKPNQVGTLSETVEAARAARESGMALVASHRSGETNDTWIADIAVGLGAEYCKAGSLARGERVAKYNRLIEIEQALSA